MKYMQHKCIRFLWWLHYHTINHSYMYRCMKYNYCVYVQNKWKYISTNFNFFVSTRFLWCNIKILVTQHKKQLCIMVEYANFFKAYRIWLFVIIAQLNAFGVIMHRIFKVYMGCEYKLKETWFHNSHGCKFCSWWTPV